MGLKCSLFGHEFDETATQRERREQEDEVVTVVREVERCSRCGSERVVSKNKEVVSVVDAEEAGIAEGEGGGPTGGIGGAVDRAGASDAEGGAGAGSFNDEPFEPPESPEEDDAEILESRSTGDDDRAPGQWPEGDESEPWEPGGLADSGAASHDDEAGDAGEPERQPSADPAPTVDERPGPAGPVESDRLRCPECGTTVSTDSSMMAGDACPECQVGYLEPEQ